MQDTLELSIEGMHCGACVRRVTNALQTVPGVQSRRHYAGGDYRCCEWHRLPGKGCGVIRRVGSEKIPCPIL
jgi:hypothetical protein